MVKAASSLQGWPRTAIPSFHHTLLGKVITCQPRFIDPACQWEGGKGFVAILYPPCL